MGFAGAAPGVTFYVLANRYKYAMGNGQHSIMVCTGEQCRYQT